ncbi:MAG: M1 family metallopeptidase [Saprospiraceae bacterium]
MYKIIYLAIALTVVSCGTTKETVYQSTSEYDTEMLDTLVVTAPVYTEAERTTAFSLPPYNPEATRSYDIIHTKLDVAFDWENQHLLGKAEISISPIFYPIQSVVLDAKQFIVHSVKLGVHGQNLKYTYNDLKLNVQLDRLYNRGEKFNIFIDYTAKPNEGPIGGSSAITSDKGLFFINPTGEDTEKPRQVWTQGETENNSKWFPTFDKSNERCTQEIYMTVAADLQTLSNGILVSTKKNGDGTKTDYWKMDKPHAPYLFMMMVGDFARVSDSWNGKLLEYMVDPPYKDDAKAIFNNTSEMLTFFSELLDYPYPWDKYSQVIAEDYVSGAMENTTAVIFGDFIQKTKRELIDSENDQIIAHEMFHHWFGDLVTCESWANLTLNEGFANYSEYLWYEHKYGKDAADAIRMSEMEGYFYMADQSGTHPLIHYGYGDKEDMFDAHSYNKGGLVLHMLRNIVGDDAFFAALSKYLKDNEYTAVETAQLRMAFETITGQDLNWFFDQWYLDKGHPELNVSSTYVNNTINIFIEQSQDPENHRPIFILPFETAVYANDGSITYHNTVVDARYDTITINNIKQKPLLVNLDGKCTMLGTIDNSFSEEQLATLVKYSPYYFDKTASLRMMSNTELLQSLAQNLIEEKNSSLRIQGLKNAGPQLIDRIKTMIHSDPHSGVRGQALLAYESIVGAESVTIIEEVIKREQVYPVIKTALDLLYIHDSNSAIQSAEILMKDPSPALATSLATIFANSGDGKYLSYIQDNLTKVNIYQIFNIFSKYSDLLTMQSDKVMFSKVKNFSDMAINDGNLYRRFLATNTINAVKNKIIENTEKASDDTIKANLLDYIDQLNSLLSEIISKEKDETLQARYTNF